MTPRASRRDRTAVVRNMALRDGERTARASEQSYRTDEW